MLSVFYEVPKPHGFGGALAYVLTAFNECLNVNSGTTVLLTGPLRNPMVGNKSPTWSDQHPFNDRRRATGQSARSSFQTRHGAVGAHRHIPARVCHA